ncbi:response regulator [Halobaculum sp. WSA2]|uniref:Response regulator n=1 Tax=Halobaculum saliterrae TaxID=2073113 RepID=A0A6B0SW68_9EURY|nr:response regulator transcription factor [Halobaculum saliterrae]MXR40190.1 response regulator [Halobaculum saliterrae]
MSATIVTVDDDETTRQLLRHRLGREGYDVHVFPDGQAAAEGFGDLPKDPDLLVLDVMMPRLDGKRLLRRIRNGETALDAETPVIMLTSRAREADVLDGFESGANDYLAKPFSPSELVARVRRQLPG